MLLILPQEANLSSGVKHLSLSEAVDRSNVFVVERVDPFLKTVRLYQQPEPKDGRTAELSVTYAMFKVKECLYMKNSSILCDREDVLASPIQDSCSGKKNKSKNENLRFAERPGDTLWLVNSSEVRNNEIMTIYVERGINEWPIIPIMKESISIEDISKKKLYLLLASENPFYQAYEGVAGWGLVSISRKKEVLSILKQQPRPSRPKQ
ncbi:MAG: hypothetical protein JW768_10645 [Chitinispirillaceae bacterium]|nr:hypothetical protein [Chitinispirillaceae bacterium]